MSFILQHFLSTLRSMIVILQFLIQIEQQIQVIECVQFYSNDTNVHSETFEEGGVTLEKLVLG